MSRTLVGLREFVEKKKQRKNKLRGGTEKKNSRNTKEEKKKRLRTGKKKQKEKGKRTELERKNRGEGTMKIWRAKQGASALRGKTEGKNGN